MSFASWASGGAGGAGGGGGGEVQDEGRNSGAKRISQIEMNFISPAPSSHIECSNSDTRPAVGAKS